MTDTKEKADSDVAEEEILAVEKLRRYQWTKGEKTGVVETYEKEGEENGINWIYFKSGRRINTTLTSEFMVELAENENPLSIQSDMDSKAPIYPSASPNPTQPAKEPESPLKIVLKKQSKANSQTVTLKFDINIPTKDVFEILKDSFDLDVEEEIISMAIESADTENIKSNLKDTITSTIKSYYE